MFKALVKKELREHLPAAGAALAASLLLLAYYMRLPMRGSGYGSGWYQVTYNYLPVPVASGAYVSGLAAVAFAAALLLGFLMSWKESVRKTWSFLLHRPVSRAQVLGAKLTAGALLYTAAVALPFALLAVWCMVPGNYPAPWDPEYLLPGVEVLCGGAVLFLGAFLCGVRRARWYATRFAPLAGAVFMLVLVAAAFLWWESWVLLLVTAAVLLASLWTVFVRAGRRGAALTLVVSIGLTAAAVVVVFIGVGIVEAWMRAAIPVGDQVSEHVDFSEDGRPRIVASRGYERVRTISDLDGNVIAKDVSSKKLKGAPGTGLSLNSREERWRRAGRKSYSVQRLHIGRGRRGEPIYFALWDQGLIVAYDWDSRRPVGYYGRGGFTADRPSATSFGKFREIANWSGHWGDGAPRVSVGTNAGIFLLDFGERSCRQLSSAPARSHQRVYDNKEHRYTRRTFVREPGHVAVYDGLKAVTRVKLPEGVADEEWLTAFLLPEGGIGLTVGTRAKVGPNVLVYKLDASGKVTFEKGVEINRRFRDSDKSLLLALAGLIPGANPLFTVPAFLHLAASGEFPRGEGLKQATGFFAVAAIKVLACAVAIFLLLGGRGLPVGRRVCWALFGLLAGLPAVLTVWALVLAAEKKVPCPKCGGKRAPSSGACPKCGAGWPAPERREVDLFSPA
jgi:ABC-type transport system involved in multi-copper enzyme maturation permease subunit